MENTSMSVDLALPTAEHGCRFRAVQNACNTALLQASKRKETLASLGGARA